MKTYQKIIVILLIIIAIPLIAALFVSKEFKTEREIVIDKPKSAVFDYVKYVKNQDNYGVWQLSDPAAQVVEEGTDGTVGYTYSWDGKKVGKGSQTITNIVENEKLETALDFGFGSPSQSYILTEEVGPAQTKVIWAISGKSPYPWNLMSLFYDMGEDFEKGLQNLKEILETQPDDKAALLDYYQGTFDELHKSVEGLTQEQLHFKPAADKWSIIECIEHIVLAEPLLLEWFKAGMEQRANPERKDSITVSDGDIKGFVTDREYKADAPENMTPTGKYEDAEQALEDLQTQRKTILATLSQYSTDDMRNHVLDLPTGKADAYQFALFIAGHTARHTLQIEEVKGHQDFPKE